GYLSVDELRVVREPGTEVFGYGPLMPQVPCRHTPTVEEFDDEASPAAALKCRSGRPLSLRTDAIMLALYPHRARVVRERCLMLQEADSPTGAVERLGETLLSRPLALDALVHHSLASRGVVTGSAKVVNERAAAGVRITVVTHQSHKGPCEMGRAPRP